MIEWSEFLIAMSSKFGFQIDKWIGKFHKVRQTFPGR